jgi:hypothetical protein
MDIQPPSQLGNVAFTLIDDPIKMGTALQE